MRFVCPIKNKIEGKKICFLRISSILLSQKSTTLFVMNEKKRVLMLVSENVTLKSHFYILLCNI